MVRSGKSGRPWLTFGLVVLTAGPGWRFGAAPAELIYDRQAIAAGEIWRLLTGHFVHSDLNHLAWNAAALLLIGSLLEGFGRRQMGAAIVVGIVAVDLALWFGMPDLEKYCGLSGMLNALLVVALAEGWRRTRHSLFAGAALVSLLKLVVEAMMGQGLLVQTAWPSVPLAHVAGFLGGALLWLCAARRVADATRLDGAPIPVSASSQTVRRIEDALSPSRPVQAPRKWHRLGHP
jgi:rhomboid family GlyGly-CTERM serine protease